MTSHATTTPAPGTLGHHAFDVLFGHWHGRNRKLRDVTDPDCEEWVEFESVHETAPVLAGTGHIDVMTVAESEAMAAFEALTLRLHDPAADTWSIWWLSTRAPGQMDPPVVGKADRAGGVFECDDVVCGRPVRVRFTWDWSDPAAPIYRQAFSDPGDDVWRTNWESVLTRADGHMPR